MPTDPVQTTDVILLAAGASARLGRPKQLLPYRGSTLLRYLTEQAIASNANHVRVVLGAHPQLIRDQVADLIVTVIDHQHWSGGLSTSIQAGVASLPKDVDSVILMLGDQPRVSSEHLNALIDEQHRTKKGLVASRYHQMPGVPALFSRRHFGDLMNLRGDDGAKTVLLLRADDTAYVDLAGGEIDIDTEEDWRRVSER
ncbi:MAG: nucleotidyltransferase family protein [Bacteroidetes bacterium]|jgi:molybdenum cofactor cytidylyltransferase|nr:nucleotidyltransferase family protein [Bacteroidota bacterium]